MCSLDFCLQKEGSVCVFTHSPVLMPCVEQLSWNVSPF